MLFPRRLRGEWIKTISEAVVPKMKTHRGAAKRFKKTKSGKLKYRRGFRNHILTKKSSKRKRHLRSDGYVADADAPRIKALLPYA